MEMYFPTELPERPQKTSRLALPKRWTHKLALKGPKRKHLNSIVISPPVATESHVPSIALSELSPKDGIYPHNLIRQTTPHDSPARELRSCLDSPQSEMVRLADSKPAGAQPHSPYEGFHHISPFSRLHMAPQPSRIARKKLPPSAANIFVEDPLLARFRELSSSTSRQGRTTTFAPTTSPLLPHPTTNISSPLPLQKDSNIAANLAWTKVAVSDPIVPALEQESQLSSDRQDLNSYRRPSRSLQSRTLKLILIDDEGGVDTEERPKHPFSKVNSSQSGSREQPSQQLRRSPFTRRDKHRSRSYIVSSGESEGGLTPASSEDVSYPDLTACLITSETRSSVQTTWSPPSRYSSITLDGDASDTQEEQDRQLAERLQLEEDSYSVAISTFFEQSSSTRQQSTPVQTTTMNRQFSRTKQATTQQGTQYDPINLDSDSDGLDQTDVQARKRLHEYWTAYGDLIEFDSSDSDYELSNVSKALKRDELLAKELQAEEDQNQQSLLKSRDCVVCAESFLIVDLPALADCQHQPETCSECYVGWITAQLSDSGWREVRCPGNKCEINLTYHEIQQYATTECFQAYDNFIARAAISEDPDFRWCRACESGQIHASGEEGNIFTCASCGHKVCILHENTWHEDETCEEYEYRSSGRKEQDEKVQEEASLQAIGELSKKCPGKNCVYNIEKNDGCDHMTCSKCRYEFCWICLCDYNQVRRTGNSAHTTDCKYHSGRLV